MYIDIKDISYRINSCDILTNINFQANTGEIISILGSNGAGKSTLLKLIAGDFTPTSGDILFDKKCLSNISIAERAKIRSVMSSPIDIPFNYTVLDIMEMGWLSSVNNNENDFTKKLDLISRECNIDNLITRSYNSLSAGEKGRVNLARSIIQVSSDNDTNKFILLDEPSENLDPFYEKKMMDIIKSKAEENYGVIMVQHNLNIAFQYSDKVLLLKDGKIFHFGKKDFIMTEENLSDLYEIPIFVNNNFINIKYKK